MSACAPGRVVGDAVRVEIAAEQGAHPQERVTHADTAIPAKEIER